MRTGAISPPDSDSFQPLEEPGFETYVGPVEAATGDDGTVYLRFTIEPRHLNGANMLHGGMMMSFAGMALRHAARSVAGEGAEALSINCDFVGPGKPGHVAEAITAITRRTRTVVFLSADLVSDGNVLMAATGVFRIPSKEEKAKEESGK